MSGSGPITDDDVDRLYREIERDAESGGYHIHPDRVFTERLVRGLIENERRYGYRSCPCRLSAGSPGEDVDIVCPCDYRDPDLSEFGACYCALYVSKEAREGKVPIGSIPERRPPRAERERARAEQARTAGAPAQLPFPVWRCSVCGYLCAREAPPLQCPICKVGRERFGRFI
ncbi:MAG: ferredoxin:glutaredoxin reductase [Methanospirillum sp.]|nr:ferredoxin:glutaredoxin reductase [Methanospirillum sp.]